MPKLVLMLAGGRERALTVPAGISILEAARLHDVPIEGACGGSMACATCHVQVDGDWYDRLPPASAEEQDMLDLAVEWCPTSRLGCQLRVTDALDGLVLRVPASTLLGGGK